MKQLSIIALFQFITFLAHSQYLITFKNGHIAKVKSVLKSSEGNVTITEFGKENAPTTWDKKYVDAYIVSITKTDLSAVISNNSNDSQNPTNINNIQTVSENIVSYESSDFLGKSVTFKKIELTEKFTILTFEYKKTSLFEQFLNVSSATYLYNKMDVRETFRILNIGDYTMDSFIPSPKKGEIKIIKLYFERVNEGIPIINYRGPSINPSLIPDYLISGIKIENPITTPVKTVPKVVSDTDEKVVCITCGNLGKIRCSSCGGAGNVRTSRSVLKSVPVRKSRSVRDYNGNFKTEYYTENESQFATEYYYADCGVCHATGKLNCPNILNHKPK